MPKFFFRSRFWFFVCTLLAFCIATVAACLAPEQSPASLFFYKAANPLFGGVAGYILDRAFFPFAQPSSYLYYDYYNDPNRAGDDGEPDFRVSDGYGYAFLIASLRQGSLIFAGILAAGMGL